MFTVGHIEAAVQEAANAYGLHGLVTRHGTSTYVEFAAVKWHDPCAHQTPEPHWDMFSKTGVLPPRHPSQPTCTQCRNGTITLGATPVPAFVGPQRAGKLEAWLWDRAERTAAFAAERTEAFRLGTLETNGSGKDHTHRKGA